MGIKFSKIAEALREVQQDPINEYVGICGNLRLELEDSGAVQLDSLSNCEFGKLLNAQIFFGWPEHSGRDAYPVGGPAEYCKRHKWNDDPNSGQKRRRLLQYAIEYCEANPDKELEL